MPTQKISAISWREQCYIIADWTTRGKLQGQIIMFLHLTCSQFILKICLATWLLKEFNPPPLHRTGHGDLFSNHCFHGYIILLRLTTANFPCKGSKGRKKKKTLSN
jgi:hypothetical protein